MTISSPRDFTAKAPFPHAPDLEATVLNGGGGGRSRPGRRGQKLLNKIMKKILRGSPNDSMTLLPTRFSNFTTQVEKENHMQKVYHRLHSTREASGCQKSTCTA